MRTNDSVYTGTSLPYNLICNHRKNATGLAGFNHQLAPLLRVGLIGAITFVIQLDILGSTGLSKLTTGHEYKLPRAYNQTYVHRRLQHFCLVEIMIFFIG